MGLFTPSERRMERRKGKRKAERDNETGGARRENDGEKDGGGS